MMIKLPSTPPIISGKKQKVSRFPAQLQSIIPSATLRLLLACGILIILSIGDQAKGQQVKKNVLFIAVDDLKPTLGCYGDKSVISPNIDALARRGTVFLNNYCQQAVCGPTRASLLTGKRPDYTKVYDLKTLIRDVNPTIVTLPQYLHSMGFTTAGIGKIFDSRTVDKSADKLSWSIPFYETEPKYYDSILGVPALGQYQLAATKQAAAEKMKEATAKGLSGKEARLFAQEKVRPTTECLNVADNAYVDGAIALKAKDILAEFAKQQKPFFFGVGFVRPHLPFVAPKKYWDLYKRDQMPLAPYQEKVKDGVDMAYHNASEMRLYSDIPDLLSFTDQKDYGISIPREKQQELIQGYYAAVSYMDAQVGLLIHALDSLGLSKNTIIVLWGDHGWHLGDHNLWCKHTNFEQATRSPLIISAPDFKAGTTSSMSEHVDIFPTVCQLSGVPVPADIDGKSLAPVLENAKHSVKEYAVSQYPRSSKGVEKERLGFSATKYMGYSIRDKRYRYTVWMPENYRSNQPFKQELVMAAELYDYQKDPNETTNFLQVGKYKKVREKMEKMMTDFFAAQMK